MRTNTQACTSARARARRETPGVTPQVGHQTIKWSSLRASDKSKYIAMSVPTLDMQLVESDRGEAAKQLVAALEETGFLFVKNAKGYNPGM